jgi:hypothetical protein
MFQIIKDKFILHCMFDTKLSLTCRGQSGKVSLHTQPPKRVPHKHGALSDPRSDDVSNAFGMGEDGPGHFAVDHAAVALRQDDGCIESGNEKISKVCRSGCSFVPRFGVGQMHQVSQVCLLTIEIEPVSTRKNKNAKR